MNVSFEKGSPTDILHNKLKHITKQQSEYSTYDNDVDVNLHHETFKNYNDIYKIFISILLIIVIIYLIRCLF